ncbi:MAG: sigma factor [Patescibacteria group bacterium]
MTDVRRPLSARDHARINRVLPECEELASKIGSRWRRTPVEDLLSVGTLRLTEIAPRFDPAVQDDFMAYAYPHVRGAMLREAMKTATIHARTRPPVRPPSQVRRFVIGPPCG